MAERAQITINSHKDAINHKEIFPLSKSYSERHFVELELWYSGCSRKLPHLWSLRHFQDRKTTQYPLPTGIVDSLL